MTQNFSGWADKRLADAYDLIWDAQQDSNRAADGLTAEFNKLLNRVEDMDKELAEARAA